MKKLKFFFVAVLTVIFVNVQSQPISVDLVAPVTIDSLVSSPQMPAGFRLANVKFLDGGSSDYASHIQILNSSGDIVWRHGNMLSMSPGVNGGIFNARRVNDTTVTHYVFSNDGGYHVVLNNDYSVRDTVRAVGIGNSGRTRPHGLLILDNGNYLTMGNRFEIIDASLVGVEIKPGVVLGGSSTIEQIMIQEIDADDGGIVQEWLSLDHIDPIATLDTSKVSVNTSIKILHTNSLDAFYDQGDLKLLTSNRESNELMIVNWVTGQIEERIQGRNATMSFIPAIYSNDSLDLHGQHYATILNWDSVNRKMDIVVFNNRFNVERAEGLVLRLDFQLGIVKKLNSFIANPDLKSTHLGNVDQYGNNWLVNWGRTYNGRENATGYDQFGIPQFHLRLPDMVDSYRILPITQTEMDALTAQRPSITQVGCLLTSSMPGYWQDGSFAANFEVTEPGEYFVESSHGVGWLRSEPVKITDTANGCGTTGIAGIKSRDLSVYPNPTNGVVNIDAGTPVPYVVVNTMGQIVTQGSGNRIDLLDQPAGLYFLRIINSTKKVVKQ